MTEATAVAALPPIAMTIRDGRPHVTSRDVAETFGKEHRDVLKKIRDLDCSEEFRLRNFAQSSHLNSQNKPQPMVEMTRDGFTFLAMGFTGPMAARFKEAYIAAFSAMEGQLRNGGPQPLVASQLGLLSQRQAEADDKLNAMLDLLKVTKRYVQVLEANQRVPLRTQPYALVVPELAKRALELLAGGMSRRHVAAHLNISSSQVHRISQGVPLGEVTAEMLAALKAELQAKEEALA